MPKKETLSIAMERIGTLHDLARREKYHNLGLSRRYIVLMEKIAMRTDTTLPAAIKRSYCKKCKTHYKMDTRMRIKGGRIFLLTCGECGDTRRFFYGKK